MSYQIKLIFFIVISAYFVWLSRSSLRNFRTHGFYRFFAFETILILVLLNINYWFIEPFHHHQIASWILLLTSLLLAIHGAWMLRKIGKPDKNRMDPSLLGLEKTTELITTGAYRYIRHPLYASLFHGTWGVYLKNPSWPGLILTVLGIFFVTMTAKIEEEENIRYFGPDYKEYMKKSKMFIPYVF